MIVVGIDPGISGALAWYDTNGERLLGVADMPVLELKVGKSTKREVSAQMLVEILGRLPVDLAIIEKVGAMPGQGVTSMFSFGKSAGIVEGAVAGLQYPLRLVTPQRWQKAAGQRPGKDGGRMRATQLWPDSAHLFKRVKDDGRADAALIARFG